MLIFLCTALANPEATEAPATGDETEVAAPEGPVELGPDALVVKKRVMPQYPESVMSGDMKCKATVIIGADGVPREVTVRSDCGLAFAAAAEKAFLQWRWEPPKVDGVPVEAKTTLAVVFRSSSGSFVEQMTVAQFNTIMRAHAPLEPARESKEDRCVVKSTLHGSGDVSGLASNDPQNCLVIPVGGKTPGKIWKTVTEPESCRMSFKSQDGFIRALKYTGCDSALMKPTEKMLGTWQFNDTKEGRDYDLTLTFDPSAP